MELERFLKNNEIPWKNLKIYQEAFTHPSYANERHKHVRHYERLEFLGDAVLQLYVSRHIFNLYPNKPEGKLTTLRSKLVREESLARFARELKIGDYVYLGLGERNNGGATRDSVLANVFEALIGAIYSDAGEEEVLKLLNKTIFKHITDVDYDDITDYKTTLQEMIQADTRKTVTYKLLDSTGPSNAPTFTISAMMGDICLGVGTGSSKKRAEQKAAKAALGKLAK